VDINNVVKFKQDVMSSAGKLRTFCGCSLLIVPVFQGDFYVHASAPEEVDRAEAYEHTMAHSAAAAAFGVDSSCKY
jgi:hypothetical protein